MDQKDTTIIHLTRDYFPAIATLASYGYSTAMAGKGFQVHMICTGRDGERESEECDGVKVSRIFIEQGASIRSTARYHTACLKTIGEIADDCDGQLMMHVYYNISNAYVAQAARLKSSVRKRSKWVMEVRTSLVKGGIREKIDNFVFNSAVGAYDGLVFIDDMLKDRMLARKRETRAISVPVGTNLENFKPNGDNREAKKKLGYQDRDFVFIYAGVLHPTRNLEVILSALAELGGGVRGKTPRLLFVGDGDDRKNLTEKSERMGLAENVRFQGRVPYSELPALINAADAALSFVPITDIYDVQPPKKTVDYLASGLPVIATDTVGNRRFITNGDNGILVRDNPRELASAMKKIIEDDDLRESLANKARRSVSEYDYKAITENLLLPFYSAILNNDK
jgi:glycosyltransferase involved in cell wall biosynthesis